MMRGIEDLERNLANLAATAPDGAGIVEAARADASRIRRRRRILVISAASAVLVVVIAGIPAAISGLGQRAPDPAAPEYRGRLQLTVDIDPGGNFSKWSYGTTATSQYIVARSTPFRQPPAADDVPFGITVYDPGTYDASQLLGGERVTVQGHTAYYVSDLIRFTATDPAQRDLGSPVVGWQDASGAWVLVNASILPPRDPKPHVLRIAEFVRLTPPRDILAPYSLSYIPGGLDTYGAQVSWLGPAKGDALVGFGTPANPLQSAGGGPAADSPLSIRARPTIAGDEVGLRQTTPIAGYDVWYNPTGENGSNLVFKHGTCIVYIFVADRDRIPLSELTRMLEGARFYDCTNPATWVKPLP